MNKSTLSVLFFFLLCWQHVNSYPPADQLYEDLLYMYNKIVRPVENATDVLAVKFGSSLIRIIDVDERNQVFTTNLWLEMQWKDKNLKWEPGKYGNVTQLHMPSDQIWTPDIVLYNNADGYPHVTINNDAMVYYDGTVLWKPPAIFKSFCEIDVMYFPYDVQKCQIKFVGWTNDGAVMDMVLIPSVINNQYENVTTVWDVDDKPPSQSLHLDNGMDLSYFYRSAEWDLINQTADRHAKVYPGCCGQMIYIDITFTLTLRRKALFYTVNLVVPCMLIAILTTVVFFLPAEDKHKITFAISILVTLTIFFLVLIDLIPPTSLVIPLIGKYLLFTMMLVGVSIFISVITVNLYKRSGATHTRMPRWMRWLFLKKLPKILCLKPYEEDTSDGSSISSSSTARKTSGSIASRRSSPYFMNAAQSSDANERLSQLAQLRGMDPDVIRRMIDNINFIADHFWEAEQEDKLSNDWSYVAMVMDRLFLFIFTVVNLGGTMGIILQAPSFSDTRPALPITSPHEPLGGDTLGHLYKYYNNT